MEFVKIFLLFFISIACSLSQTIEENYEVVEPRIDSSINFPLNSIRNCNGRLCRQTKSRYPNNQRCICFPLNSNNLPVLEHIRNDFQDPIERTVVYIYNIGNKSTIYVPNSQKQSIFTDLTLDDGDVLRPLPSHNINFLTALDKLPQNENGNQGRRNNAEITITENEPIILQSQETVVSPSSSEQKNKEALNHIFENDFNLLASYEYPSTQDFGDIEEPKYPYDEDDALSVFGTYSQENDYAENVDEDYSVLASKPVDQNVPVDDPENGLESTVDEQFLHEFGLKPNEHKIIYPHKGFGYDEDENQSHNSFELEPLEQNINRSLTIPGMKSNSKNVYLQNADRPVKVSESNSNEEITHERDQSPKIHFGINSNNGHFPLYYNSEPPFGANNIRPQNVFGLGTLWNTLPVNSIGLKTFEPQRKVELEIDENNLTSAGFTKHRPSISCSFGICKLYIYCSRNECPKYLQSLSKLHANIHKHPYLDNTFVAIDNVQENINSTDSQLKSFFDMIGLENAGNAIQKIRSVQLEEENVNNHLNRVLRKQVPRSIPINLDPLLGTLEQPSPLQNLPLPRPIKDQLFEFYPNSKQILSTQIFNQPQRRGIYFPMPHHNQQPGQLQNNLKVTPLTPDKISKSKYRSIYFPMPQHGQQPGQLTKNSKVIPLAPDEKDTPKFRSIFFPTPNRDQPVTPEKEDSLKDLLLLPSKIHHEGMKTVANLIPGLSLRRINVDKEEPKEIEVPANEDDIKIKIIGGQPAVSSGTPMQIKARLGDV